MTNKKISEMTDEEYANELRFGQALDKVINNYKSKGDIGYSHMVGGWICRELKERGDLAVTDAEEKRLFDRAKQEVKKRLEVIARERVGGLSGLVFGCTAKRDCPVCKDFETCKILVNYKDMLALYVWLKDNFGGVG
jgi:hypothetical protein